jgi:hypothetical protein
LVVALSQVLSGFPLDYQPALDNHVEFVLGDRLSEVEYFFRNFPLNQQAPPPQFQGKRVHVDGFAEAETKRVVNLEEPLR